MTTQPTSAPTPRTDASYVVTAYRWGQRNAHSYVVGSFSDLNRAKQCADEHVDYRGGKYACEVAQAGSWSEDDDDVARQVYYVESPYYGMAHDCGHFHPADCAKRGRPSAKPFTVRELQNELAAKDREIARLNELLAAEKNYHGQAQAAAYEQNEIANRLSKELADLKNAGGPPFIRSEAIRNLRDQVCGLKARAEKAEMRVKELENKYERH